MDFARPTKDDFSTIIKCVISIQDCRDPFIILRNIDVTYMPHGIQIWFRTTELVVFKCLSFHGVFKVAATSGAANLTRACSAPEVQVIQLPRTQYIWIDSCRSNRRQTRLQNFHSLTIFHLKLTHLKYETFVSSYETFNSSLKLSCQNHTIFDWKI